MTKVSLYIPAFNVESHLSRCVAAVHAQTHPPDEILVIDDGSTDDTAPIAADLPGVTLIQHDGNRGLGAARNTALETARHELIASLDADTAPSPTWLQTLLPHLESPDVAGASGPLFENAIHNAADRWRRNFMTQSWGNQRIVNPPHLNGNNGLHRKSALLAVGGYDARRRTNCEDVDISRRLNAAGWQTIYDPAAEVLHYRTDTVDSIFNTHFNWLALDVRLQDRAMTLPELAQLVGYHWAISAWRIACPRPDWFSPSQLLLNLKFPPYMTRRLLTAYRESRRQISNVTTSPAHDSPPPLASRMP